MSASAIRRRLVAFAAIGLVACSSPEPSPLSQPGWTGQSHPADVIHARAELMEHVEELMEPIDSLEVGASPDPALVHRNAEMIGAMLTALPHLFPPTTNLYDPSTLEPKTLALPPIWTDFDAFYRLAGAAVGAADRLATAEGLPDLRERGLALRTSCDGCHALFLRKYEPPRVLDSDLEFDFGKALP